MVPVLVPVLLPVLVPVLVPGSQRRGKDTAGQLVKKLRLLLAGFKKRFLLRTLFISSLHFVQLCSVLVAWISHHIPDTYLLNRVVHFLTSSAVVSHFLDY